MTNFNKLYKNIIKEYNIVFEAECKPNTMLNQKDLNAKKIPQERKAKVVVKKDGNTTGITYNVDSDTSAEYMADNIKANGGSASISKSSGVTNEDTDSVESTNFANVTWDRNLYLKFLKEGKLLGIEAVTDYLNQHTAELSDDFSFGNATEDQYFEEYALVKYNNSL